ncbi:MAG: hypothetical protein AAB621_02370 [Patescibacteria group bacterium]
MKLKSSVKCRCGCGIVRVLSADEETTQIYFTDKKGKAIKSCPKCKKVIR